MVLVENDEFQMARFNLSVLGTRVYLHLLPMILLEASWLCYLVRTQSVSFGKINDYAENFWSFLVSLHTYFGKTDISYTGFERPCTISFLFKAPIPLQSSFSVVYLRS